MHWKETTDLILEQINEMDEFHLRAYERADLYKERMKKYHDQRIIHREFTKGDLVLLFNSKLKLFLGKLKSKWLGPFKISQVYSSGVVELENEDGSVFKVNRQRIKLYIGPKYLIKSVDVFYLDEV